MTQYHDRLGIPDPSPSRDIKAAYLRLLLKARDENASEAHIGALVEARDQLISEQGCVLAAPDEHAPLPLQALREDAAQCADAFHPESAYWDQLDGFSLLDLLACHQHSIDRKLEKLVFQDPELSARISAAFALFAVVYGEAAEYQNCPLDFWSRFPKEFTIHGHRTFTLMERVVQCRLPMTKLGKFMLDSEAFFKAMVEDLQILRAVGADELMAMAMLRDSVKEVIACEPILQQNFTFGALAQLARDNQSLALQLIQDEDFKKTPQFEAAVEMFKEQHAIPFALLLEHTALGEKSGKALFEAMYPQNRLSPKRLSRARRSDSLARRDGLNLAGVNTQDFTVLKANDALAIRCDAYRRLKFSLGKASLTPENFVRWSRTAELTGEDVVALCHLDHRIFDWVAFSDTPAQKDEHDGLLRFGRYDNLPDDIFNLAKRDEELRRVLMSREDFADVWTQARLINLIHYATDPALSDWLLEQPPLKRVLLEGDEGGRFELAVRLSRDPRPTPLELYYFWEAVCHEGCEASAKKLLDFFERGVAIVPDLSGQPYPFLEALAGFAAMQRQRMAQDQPFDFHHDPAYTLGECLVADNLENRYALSQGYRTSWPDIAAEYDLILMLQGYEFPAEEEVAQRCEGIAALSAERKIACLERYVGSNGELPSDLVGSLSDDEVLHWRYTHHCRTFTVAEWSRLAEILPRDSDQLQAWFMVPADQRHALAFDPAPFRWQAYAYEAPEQCRQNALQYARELSQSPDISNLRTFIRQFCEAIREPLVKGIKNDVGKAEYKKIASEHTFLSALTELEALAQTALEDKTKRHMYAKQAQQYVKTLREEAQTFLAKSVADQQSDYPRFRQTCKENIACMDRAFSKNHNWKQVRRNLLYAIVGLGVFYLFAVAIKGLATGRCFFAKPPSSASVHQAKQSIKHFQPPVSVR